jgi:hypothetical protein
MARRPPAAADVRAAADSASSSSSSRQPLHTLRAQCEMMENKNTGGGGFELRAPAPGALRPRVPHWLLFLEPTALLTWAPQH